MSFPSMPANQYMVPQQLPVVMQKPVYPNQDQDCKLHISQLHETITEELLWKEFKQFGTITSIRVLRDKETQRSKKSAKITFNTADEAKKALTNMNLTYLIKGDIVQNQKRIIVSKDITYDKLQALKKSNIYIKGIPAGTEPKTLYNFLTQFGDILSMSVIDKKDGSAFGFVLFEKKEDNEKILSRVDENKRLVNDKFNDTILTLEGYINPSERQTTSTNNLYIKDFCDYEFSEEDLKNQDLVDKKIEEQTEVLKNLLKGYGEITSVLVSVCSEKKKLYAFVCFSDATAAETVFNDFSNDKFKSQNENLYINLSTKKSNSKSSGSEDRCLFLKNLKHFEDETEKANFEKRVRDVLETYGKIASLKVQKGNKPKDKTTLADSNYAIVFYVTEDNAKKFLHNYLDSKEVCSLFQKDNANGCVTICMPSHERKRMLRSKNQNIRNNLNFQQQAQQQNYMRELAQNPNMGGFPQQFGKGQNMGGFPKNQNMGQYQMGQNNMIVGKQFYPNRGPMGQQQRQPHRQGGQGGQGFQGRQQRQNIQQGQARPVQQQPKAAPVAPKPVQDQPQAQAAQAEQKPAGQQQPPTVNLEDLKSNLDKFAQLEQAKQAQILGNLLYPKVREVVQDKSESESLAPKITGMLIDFSVFELTDIIDFLESPEELKERVEEAITLIKQQQ